MALAIQSQSNTSLGITVSATFGSNPNQDNLLIAVVTASVGTGSISLSNSGWSTGKSIAVGAAGGMVVFYKVSAAGGGDTTVTANATLAVFMDIQIFEYQLVDDESPLDLTASTADSGSGVTSCASGTTGTLTQANEVAFVAFAQDGSNGGGASLTNSFGLELTTAHLITGDISVAATTALSSTASWTNSVRSAGVILTFFGEVGDSYGPKYQLKPRVPIINFNHPITKGLVFDCPLYEGGGTTTKDLVGKELGTFSNGPAWAMDMYGKVVTFANNTNIDTFLSKAPQNSVSFVSIEALVFPTSASAGLDPRYIHKGNSSKYFSMNANGKFQLSVAWATTEGDWSTPTFAYGAWYHVVTTYSYSAVGNTPLIYVNAQSQTLSVDSSPAGAAPTDTTDLAIGNRPVGGATKGFVGNIAYVRYWNRILNQQEVKTLYTNPWCIYTQPGLLRKR